jgi:hypothetical protein
MSPRERLTAILPRNDLDAAFHARLGSTHREGDDAYRMLSDGRGSELHLTAAVGGWLIPGRNPFGLYLHTERVDELAAAMGCAAQATPWDMYECALSDPDETLVRVGWPSRLRRRP